MTAKHVQRNLTIMFTDISGFTKHTEKIGREDLMDRLDTHNKLLMPIVAHFEGKIIKTIGDSFLITFESPTNAVECGTFAQHTLRKFNEGKPDGEQIHIKISINAGEVSVTENDVFGDPVNVAAKIEKVTAPDEIYFTEAVFLAMNKAEVPNTFVKTFRPRGADSQEIKLYKVVQDLNDAMYKRIVTDTKIDGDKIKTRVLELSNLAEKEYSRYQDTLDQLVQQQGKSSRSTIFAVVAAALLIAGAIVLGFILTQGKGTTTSVDPKQRLEADVHAFLTADKPKDARTVVESFVKEHGETDSSRNLLEEIKKYESNTAEREHDTQIANAKSQLEKDVRAFLAVDKPKDARTVIATYVKQYGDNDTSRNMTGEIHSYEVNVVARDGEKLLAAAKPEQALAAIDEVTGKDKRTDVLDKLAKRCEALQKALKLLDEGDAKGAQAAFDEAFGDQTPGDAIKTIRTRISAMGDARAIMEAADAQGRSDQVISLLSGAFGDETQNRACLKLLNQALTIELCKAARKEGSEKARQREAEMRKRFVHVDGWTEIEREIDLAGLWMITTDTKTKNEFRYFEGAIWETIRRLRDEAEQRKDAEFMWRIGETLYQIQRKNYQSTMDGMYDWVPAMKLDPTIVQRHPEFKDRLMHFMGFGQDADYEDDDPEHLKPDWPVRRLIKQLYFKEVRDDLIKGLDAMNGQEPYWSVRINSFCVLADMGEAGLLKDRVGFFKECLTRFFEKQEISTAHARLLFAEPMTYEDYQEYRKLIDDARTSEAFSQYGYRFGVLDQMLKDLKEVQPDNTAKYGK